MISYIFLFLVVFFSEINSQELCESTTVTKNDEVKYTSQQSLKVDDVDGHSIRIFKTETKHKDSKKNCEGRILVKTDFWGISDYIKKNGNVTGYSIATFDDGSLIFSKLTGTSHTPKDQSKNGVVVSTSKITGGTGTYKGITGFGKGKTTFNPETGYFSGTNTFFYSIKK